MNEGLRRRRFLQMAGALGLGSELGPWASLRTITPLRADDTRVKPEMVKFRPEIEPVVRLLEETPRDRALEVAIAAAQEGALIQESARRTVPGGHPQHQAAAGGLQVPRRDGDQLGARAGPVVGRQRTAAAAALGARQLQVVAGTGCQGRRLGARARRRMPAAEDRTARERNSSGPWKCGTPRPPTRPSPRSAAAQAPPRRWSRCGAWPCATSGISVTRRSSPPRAGEPCRRSAGSMPSRCCGRSSSECSTCRATPVLGPVGPYEANLENAAKIRPDWHDRPRRPSRHPGAASGHAPGDAGSGFGRSRQAAQSGRFHPARSGTPPSSPPASCSCTARDIVALHATTSTNALHYIFTASGDDTTRRLALLQAVGWQPMYRGRARS